MLYRLGGFHHVGFECNFLGHNFNIIYNSDTLLFDMNEEDIL